VGIGVGRLKPGLRTWEGGCVGIGVGRLKPGLRTWEGACGLKPGLRTWTGPGNEQPQEGERGGGEGGGQEGCGGRLETCSQQQAGSIPQGDWNERTFHFPQRIRTLIQGTFNRTGTERPAA
jgi:hypothetical protein